MFSELIHCCARLPYLLIVVAGTLLFIPYLGHVHLFDWDEINFAESAREMLLTGNYRQVQINFKPFWEKPPLFFWLQALSMKMFGINEFAARFPNAVCGILTLCFIFYIGRQYFSPAFGYWWVLVYVGSFLPHFYFKSGIIDPWFNLFIFCGIYFLFLASVTGQDNQTVYLRYMLMAGVCIGLAILTKGPVGLLIPVITAVVYSLIKKNRQWLQPSGILIFTGAVFIVTSLWYGWEVAHNGIWFIDQFVRYQIRLFTTEDSGHGGPFYYHLLVLLAGCFPASFFALNGFFDKTIANNLQHRWRLWMLLLFLITLILFSIVKTKIIHYSSLCYLPLTFFAAVSIYNMAQHVSVITANQRWLLRVSILIFGLLIGLLFAIVPLLANKIHWLYPFVNDAFARAALQVQVFWPWWMPTFGLLYAAIMVITYIKWKKQFLRSISLLYIATTIFIFWALILYVPRIERYTQGSAIDFYKSLRGKNVYVEVTGFKSYAQYFYTMKQPESAGVDKYIMLYGHIDRPAYIVTKVHKASKFQEEFPQFVKTGEAGGFVFFRRLPEN
jgi:hypothetical protein